MNNEDAIELLRETVDEIEQDCGVGDLKSSYYDFDKKKQEFKDANGTLAVAVHNTIYEAYDDDKTTVDSTHTIKHGGVYKYASSQKRDAKTLDVEDFDELSEDEKELIEKAQEEMELDIGDRISKTYKKLIPDDRDFDAAKLVTLGYSSGLRLVDLDDGRSCSGDVLEFDKDFRDYEVKEIIKQMRYQEELQEVMDEALEEADKAIEARREVIQEVKS